MNSIQTLRLKRLELVWIPSHINAEDVFHDPLMEVLSEVVAQFLQGFKGLEDLYLMFPKPNTWDAILSGIPKHRTTLRRLVTHDLVGNYSDFFDGNPSARAGFRTLYQSVPVSYLGTCIQLPVLVSTVRSLYVKMVL
jgi:hypothetical protein